MNKKIQFAQWDITGNCNLQCKHCRAWQLPRKNDLSTKEGIKLLKDLNKLGVKILNFSGGEPFLRDDIFDLLDHTKKFSIVTITTNGTLLTEDKIRKLEKFKNIRLSVSIDGLKKFHDDLRQVNGTFERALSAIKNLTRKLITTSIRFTLTSTNKNEAIPVFKVISKYNIESFNIRGVIPSGRASRSLMPNATDYKEAIEKIIKFGEKKKIRVISGDPILLPVFPQLLGETYEKFGNRIYTDICAGCIAGSDAVYIGPNGDVGVCAYIPIIAGNIRNKPLVKIVNEAPLFKKLNNFRDNLKGGCKKCVFKDLCGGCRAVALSLNKNLFAQDPRCLIK